MAIEAFSFDKGINRKKSPLFLEDGEMVTCTGFSFARDGVLEARAAKTVGAAIDAAATINGIHRYGDNIYASAKALCPGEQTYFNYIYHRDVLGTYSNVNLLGNLTRPRFADYEKFTFIVDGESKRAYVEGNGYNWGIPNPSHKPIISAGGAGNPDGEYSCYVTFYVRFPNDKYVETGPSPVATITVATAQISWDKIPICQYEGYGLTIHRRIYRTVSGTAYLVATIPDNTTETYTDDFTDATLQAATILGTDNYSVPPDNAVDVAVYLQRVFLIKDNKLYWTEPYAPFSVKTTSDVVVTKDDEDLVAVLDWGDQIFLASAERWYRLQGNDPTTWSIKRTFTDCGIINRNTLKRTIYGLIGLWSDGLYLFDGSTNKNITEKKLSRTFFTDLDDLSVCYADFDGTRYYFYYASSGSVIDSCIIIDFSYYPDYRIYSDNFIATAHEVYKGDNTRYLAYAGYEYGESGTETIATSLLTGDKAFEGIIKRKCLDYLYYDIDTGGVDVTVQIICDGSSAQTLTLNASSRQRKRAQRLKNIEGYRFSLQVDCADSQNVFIYSPWVLEGTLVGD